jgi:repressor LexA
MYGLTKRQKDLLDYIVRYKSTSGGVSPSYREMKDAVGLKTTSGIHRLVLALAERKRVIFIRGKVRTIALVEDHDTKNALGQGPIKRKGKRNL